MLQPKRTKYRKQQKGRNRGLAVRGSKVSFGEYGLKCSGRGRLTARQIEAARRAISRHVKRGAGYGSGWSPITQFLRNRLKFAWEKEKVTQNIG